MTGPWRIATRRSRLARAQAQLVADALEQATGGSTELVPMATTGDSDPKRAIEAFDSRGLFVDATREAVRSGDCEVVVHSHKDLPTGSSRGLVVGAVPQRADPRDVVIMVRQFLADGARGAAGLPYGRIVRLGTSSPRRRVQVDRLRHNIRIEPVRGNIETRLEKVLDGALEGVVVALAGLRRLGGVDSKLQMLVLDPDDCLPAPAQGALAVECREDDTETRRALTAIEDLDSARCVRAERAMLATLEGGCTAPIGALAEAVDDPRGPVLELRGMVADPEGGQIHRASASGSADDPEGLGRQLAEELLEHGGEALRGRGESDRGGAQDGA